MSVKISINTRQYDEKGNMDTIEMTAFGKIFYKNDGIYVIYKEKEENIEITNTIKILKNQLVSKSLVLLTQQCCLNVEKVVLQSM